jgi:hypothetical protein
MTDQLPTKNQRPSAFESRRFALRQHKNGTVDSFCLKCLATISRGESDYVRSERERLHFCICNGFEDWNGMRRVK